MQSTTNQFIRASVSTFVKSGNKFNLHRYVASASQLCKKANELTTLTISGFLCQKSGTSPDFVT